MGIEYRLGRQDHRKVEDYLASHPPNVDGIWVEAGNVGRQTTVMEQARATGVDVLVEPMTERLADEGFSPGAIPYAADRPFDLVRLARSSGQRSRLIEDVLAVQGDATVLTPPHFYVTDTRSAELNVALAAGTIEAAEGGDVRAILLARRDFLARPGVVEDLAVRYADIGVTALDLRLTPLGKDDDGARKVRSCFDLVNAFRREGIVVTLGYQGVVGQTGLALGVVRGFSVGIGMRESLDHGAAMATQRKPRDPTTNRFGYQAGVWLPGAEVAVPLRVATVLLNNPGIRSRLACHIGSCSKDINAPLTPIIRAAGVLEGWPCAEVPAGSGIVTVSSRLQSSPGGHFQGERYQHAVGGCGRRRGGGRRPCGVARVGAVRGPCRSAPGALGGDPGGDGGP